MSGETSSWKAFVEINVNFLRAALGFGLAWGAWQLYAPTTWIFGLIAVVSALAGAMVFMKAVFGITKLILAQRKLASFRSKGAAPKADQLAQNKELRKQGLIK